ncbi:MAG: response regulator [Bacteroidota bacterium]
MQRTPCGIVVLDVRMPEMAGVDTLRALDVALPCVLMVTGDAVEAQRPRCLTADADDFLAKPAT